MHINFNSFLFVDNENYKVLPKEVFQFLKQQKAGVLSFESTRLYALSKTTLSFSLEGLRTDDNQWHLIERVKKGQGSFGAVFPSSWKIVIQNNEAHLYRINDIIKEQDFSDCQTKAEQTERISEARQEALNQKSHRVNVPAFVVDTVRKKIFTVIHNCGVSLDKLLPGKYTFDERLRIALGITNDFLLLKQNSVVHRDLKPANICVDEKLQVTIIDFGLAAQEGSKENSQLAGTLCYMSPDHITSHASDLYALSAILAEVATCPGLLSQKNYHYMIQKDAIFYAPYNFDRLFESVTLPQDIDPRLIEDFKILLNELQSHDAKLRPSIDFVNKFLLLIYYRREDYGRFINNKNACQNKIFQLSIALTGFISPSQIKGEQLHRFSPFVKKLIRNLQLLDSDFNNTVNKTFLSHYNQTRFLSKPNCSIRNYVNPFPDLEQIEKGLDTILVDLNSLSTVLNTFSSYQDKFKGGNSQGMSEIFKILQDPQMDVTLKLEGIFEIARDKSSNSFANWYNRSAFFGQGRQPNIDRLYKQLADIHFSESPLKALESLCQILATHNFQHEDSCFTQCLKGIGF